MKENELKIWKHRWEALKQIIDDVDHGLQISPQISRVATIRTLLRCLREFGETQFEFFYRGFNDDDPKHGGYLKPSLDFPVEYVFRATLTQISHDLNLFQTIIQQRTTAENDEQVLQTLKTADHLAYKALRTAIDGELIKEATVLTYFQKMPSVRLVPYAPIALVAVPYSCITLPDKPDDLEFAARDYLAIPHEVGHYVYRHGQFNRDTLDEALRDRLIQEDHIFRRWLEEIFADVYGCLVAGPVMALDFMHLLLDHHPDEFVSYEHDHPMAAIRPYSYFAVLDEIRCTRATKELEIKWREILQKRSHFIDQKGQQYKAGLQRVAHDVYELHTFDTDQFVTERWTKDTDQIDELYNTFAAYVQSERQTVKTQSTVPDAIILDDDSGDAEVLKRKWHMGESDGLSNLWIDQLRLIAMEQEGNERLLSAQIKIPPEVWSLVLSMNGWAIEGPIPPGGNPPT